MDNKMALAKALMGGQPNPNMLGSGMAAQAGQQIKQMPNYRDYAIHMQTMGEQPLPQNDPKWQQQWMQLQQQQQAPQPQAIPGAG